MSRAGGGPVELAEAIFYCMPADGPGVPRGGTCDGVTVEEERVMSIGITMGDAGGVGPEIALKSFCEGKLPANAVVIGDMSVLRFCAAATGCKAPLHHVHSVNDTVADALNVLDMNLMTTSDIAIGKTSKQAGKAALAYVNRAVELALRHEISAIVTLPMNKDGTRLSAPDFTGHTEVIAGACGKTDYTMTLVSDRLIVPHVTAHVSLRRALDSLSVERIFNVILLARGIAGRLDRGERVAVMGVNPHAGENGAFGDEEQRIIGPAVERARSGGTEVAGPLPPDTVFMRALRGEFDVVVCMYHDQGHIPMKTIGFDDTVNVTVGLPIVRTSVDHGTAFDIAYKGVVSVGSFVHACELAERLAG